ncbi:hypothetical protein [Agrobacterium tumefaciens]|uniref:hypothetical protein n=1 Tax=Agrobacterium tumefaciens TaxID=358 RepID=UPI002786D499|nr:hypothetical protein [Agrobacterium tumefaciens]MDP9875251.1 integrase [Agrobacterium tumefaciens]MDP9980360.1 integrase [Agrobacterium tumefaciens]
MVTGHSFSQAASVTPASFNRISTFIKPWQKDIAAGYNHNKPVKDAHQYLKTVELFVGLLGDLPLGQITYDKAAEFRELVLQLPSMHGKGATQSLKKELVRARNDTTLPRVSMKTVKRHFSGMNSIWKWLIFRKHLPASHNPFSGHPFPGTKSKKSAHDDWSSKDLQRFFTSRVYRDATGGSALRWLPLIARHSGMRLEEICRLPPAVDIVMKNGVHCFDVAPREGWDPKTEFGTRIIPVHSWLIRHGFMDFVKSQRGRNVEHLFSPELPLHKGSLSSAFSRDFSRIKIDLGVGTKTTFHSFRHTFRTVLESTDLKDSHITVVEWLAIDPAEQRAAGLRVLVDRDRKRELNTERTKESRRRRGAKDRTEQQAERLSIGGMGLYLQATKGLKRDELAERFGVSTGQISKAMREARPGMSV